MKPKGILRPKGMVEPEVNIGIIKDKVRSEESLQESKRCLLEELEVLTGGRK